MNEESIHPEKLARKRLAGTLALIFAAITFGYIPILALFNASWPPYLNLAAGIVWLAIYWLNQRNYLFLTRFLQITLPLFHMVILNVFGGRESLGHFFLLIGMIVPFVTFEPEETGPRRLQTILFILGFAIVELFGKGPISSEDLAILEIIRYCNIIGLFLFMAAIIGWHLHTTAEAAQTLDQERKLSEKLLLNILPPAIAARLKRGETEIADHFSEVTVLFTDLVGFTSFSKDLPPEEVVYHLNQLFQAFDDLAANEGLSRIKTIGDAYMLAAGVPDPRPDHVSVIAKIALEMLKAVEKTNAKFPFALRIGIHTGPVVAGIIGRNRFAYDLWGDTVNTASRMESQGEPGKIQISAVVKEKLGNAFLTVPRGMVEIKGRGSMETFWLIGRQPSL